MQESTGTAGPVSRHGGFTAVSIKDAQGKLALGRASHKNAPIRSYTTMPTADGPGQIQAILLFELVRGEDQEIVSVAVILRGGNHALVNGHPSSVIRRSEIKPPDSRKFANLEPGTWNLELKPRTIVVHYSMPIVSCQLSVAHHHRFRSIPSNRSRTSREVSSIDLRVTSMTGQFGFWLKIDRA